MQNHTLCMLSVQVLDCVKINTCFYISPFSSHEQFFSYINLFILEYKSLNRFSSLNLIGFLFPAFAFVCDFNFFYIYFYVIAEETNNHCRSLRIYRVSKKTLRFPMENNNKNKLRKAQQIKKKYTKLLAHFFCIVHVCVHNFIMFCSFHSVHGNKCTQIKKRTRKI